MVKFRNVAFELFAICIARVAAGPWLNGVAGGSGDAEGYPPASAFSASSVTPGTDHFGPECSRTEINPACHDSVWRPDPTDAKPWIMVDVGEVFRLHEIHTSGRPSEDEWIVTYKFAFSTTTAAPFKYYIDMATGSAKEISANTDRETVQIETLNPQVILKIIRLEPLTWHGDSAALRWELTGVRPEILSFGNPYSVPDSGLYAKTSLQGYRANCSRGLVGGKPPNCDQHCWKATTLIGEWLQVNFGDIFEIVSIMTAGCWGETQWVSTFKLHFGTDLSNPVSWRSKIYNNLSSEIFVGNTDANSWIETVLSPTIVTGRLRIFPMDCVVECGLRWAIFGDKALILSSKINGPLPHSSLSSSSISSGNDGINRNHYCARLDNTPSDCTHPYWLPDGTDKLKWIQVDFGGIYTVYALNIAGNSGSYIGSFWISYSWSTEKEGWRIVEDVNGDQKMFTTSGVDTVRFALEPPLLARWFRLNVEECPTGHCALRWELLGQRFSGGMLNGGLYGHRLYRASTPDSQFSASSSTPDPGNFGPECSKIQPNATCLDNVWRSDPSDVKPWIMVEKPTLRQIFAVLTRGRPSADEWVTKYTIEYSHELDSPWIQYREFYTQEKKIFAGNTDRETVVENALSRTTLARRVKLVVEEYHGNPALRWEIVAGVRGLTSRETYPYGVPDAGFTASTGTGHCARMFIANGLFCSTRAWVKDAADTDPWVQVDLGRLLLLMWITTRGGTTYNPDTWVKSYNLLGGPTTDAMIFATYRDKTEYNPVFPGNVDAHNWMDHVLQIIARHVRIIPRTCENTCAFRLELFGETPRLLNSPVRGSLPDEYYDASDSIESFDSKNSAIAFYKDDWTRRMWKPNIAENWVQVDLVDIHRVYAVSTKGSYGNYVLTYKLQAAVDDVESFITYKDGSGNDKVFSAAQILSVRQLLATYLRGRWFRLYVLTCRSDHCNCEWELYGAPEVTEGLALHKGGISPYSGDMFHEMPLMLRLLTHQSKIWGQSIHILFIIIDLVTALVLERIAKHYGKYMLTKQASDVKEYSPDSKSLILKAGHLHATRLYVVAAYLFNPYTIATCVAKSTAVFNNLAIACAILFTLKNNRMKACFSIAVASYLSMYPIMLFIPAAIYLAKHDVKDGTLKQSDAAASLFQTAVCTLAALFALLYLSFMIEGSWDFLQSTYGFILTVPDLTPNVGVFWYFFTEMFEHFRAFFICVFQINVFIYSVPLAVRLREHPVFLMYILVGVMAIFKSYPSYGDTALYLSLLPLFRHAMPYMRNNFVVSVMFIVCSVLAPILWHLWIYAGSANANFYFAITLVYSTAQVFLVTDLLFAFLRREFDLYNGAKPQIINGKPAQVILD